jgi:biopolymer transport protein ExbB/TolQ
MDPNADSPHTLRQKRDELYQAARDNPGSEENEMVEALLLSAMSNTQPVLYDARPRLALSDERRRFRAARERKAQERRTRQQTLRKRRKRTGRAAKRRDASVAELQREVEKRDLRLKKIEEALKRATAAAAGKPMTHLDVYRRIAEVIGLTPPMEPIGENQG